VKIHPNDDVLEEFVLSLDGPQQSLLRHLGWCSYCRAKLHYLPRPLPIHVKDAIGNPKAGSYEAGLAESQRALSDWEAVLDLVERSLESTLQDPAFGEHLGLLALRLSESLDRERYGAERIADLRARAWAFVGNACRRRFDYPAAEEAFERAYRQLARGTRDGLERAIFLDLKASLRSDQRRFVEALRLLNRAVELFLSHGERHLAGRSLVKLSTVCNYMGRPEDCVPVLAKAVGLIDSDRDPRLLLCARHNLIFVLAELGRFNEAQRLYEEACPLYSSFNEPWVQNRRKWVRAKIAKGLGQLQRAETQFLAARDGFLAEGIPYDTALVSLELALLYAEQGRTEDLKRLAAEMVPIFASRHIHRETLAALIFFRQAVEAERAA
jgi:tetratricopeptide (TPR) repeat protein